MADYYSILSKTISGLKNNDTQMREAVYARARATIEKQLRNMDPVPSEDTIAAQLNALQEAASKLEADYTPPEPETVDIIPSSDEVVAASEPQASELQASELQASEPQESELQADVAADEEISVEETSEQVVTPTTDEQVSEPTAQSSFVIAAAEPESVAPVEELVVEEPVVETPVEPVSTAPVEEPVVETPEEPVSVASAEEPFVIAASESVSVEPVSDLPVEEPVVEASTENIDEPKIDPVADPVVDPLTSSLTDEAGEQVSADSSSIDMPNVGDDVAEAEVDFNVSEPQTVDIAPSPSISLEQEVAQSAPPDLGSSVDVEPVQSPTSDALDAVGAAVEEDESLKSEHVSVLDSQAQEPKKSGKLGCFLLIIVLLLALGGGGFGAWLNKDMLMEKAQAIFANFSPTSDDPQENTQEDGEETPEKEAVRIGEDGQDASAEPVEETEENSGETELAVDLTPEIITEPETETPQEPEEVATPDEPEEPVIETVEEDEVKEEAQPDPNSLGEVAYLYEEGPAGTGAIRVNATVVWELKKYAEPEAGRADTYIYGKMEVPERDISLDVQIDRNLDEGLSASHLIDIKFDLPEGFTGQGVDSVDRFVMKSTEEAEGEQLLAVPVKVDEGHFLIALGNAPNAEKFNSQLLLSGAWVDIPINYENGKRALLVIEKGGTGDQIFKEAFAAWTK